MQRIPNGVLPKISQESGVSPKVLSAYSSTNVRPSRHRSIVLERACKKLGFDVPKELWMFGSRDELKAALSNIN